MKYLTIVLCVLLFTTCKKDESKTEKSIIGTWKSIKVTTSEPIDLNEDGIKNTDYLKEIKGCWEYTFDFLSDGSLHLEIKSSPKGEYGEIITSECYPWDMTGTWEVNATTTKLYFELTKGISQIYLTSNFRGAQNTSITMSDNTLTINNFPDEWDDWTYKIELKKE